MIEDIISVLLRTLLIYSGGLLILRIAGNRILARESPFDLILAFTLGSTLSRAINGSASLVPTLAAFGLLAALHIITGVLGFRFPYLSKMIKGTPVTLIQDGTISWNDMKKKYLTEGDLLEALRLNAHLIEPRQVALGKLERNGNISFIPKKTAPKIMEIAVEDGVKTVRLEFH